MCGLCIAADDLTDHPFAPSYGPLGALHDRRTTQTPSSRIWHHRPLLKGQACPTFRRPPKPLTAYGIRHTAEIVGPATGRQSTSTSLPLPLPCPPPPPPAPRPSCHLPSPIPPVFWSCGCCWGLRQWVPQGGPWRQLCPAVIYPDNGACFPAASGGGCNKQRAPISLAGP